MIDYIAYIVLGLIFLTGACIFWSACNGKKVIRFRANTFSYKRLRDNFLKEWQNPDTEAMVAQAGLGISGVFYQFLRILVFSAWLLFLLYDKYYNGHDVAFAALICFALILATSPKKKMFGYTSPFQMLIDVVQRKKRDQYSLEINRCLSQLKNLAVSQSNKTFSSYYVIEELSKYTTYTKPIFGRLLGYWYEARYEEAGAYFKNEIGTDEGIALTNLFQSLNGLKPTELVTQIQMYQNAAKERRKTFSHNTREGKSNVLFGIVIATGLIILFNFLVVVLGIDLLDSFRSIH